MGGSNVQEPRTTTDLSICQDNLNRKKTVFETQALEPSAELDAFNDVLTQTDIPISHTKTSPTFTLFTSKPAISKKERFNDEILLGLYETFQETLKKRAQFIKEVKRKNTPVKKSTLTVVRMNQLAFQYEEDISTLRTFNTALNSQMKTIRERLSLIQNDIDVFLLLKEKCLTKQIELEKALDLSAYDPDFAYDEKTKATLLKLTAFKEKKAEIDKALSTALDQLSALTGKSFSSNALKRYREAATVYQHQQARFQMLFVEVSEVRTCLNQISHELKKRQEHFDAHLKCLLDRIHLVPLSLKAGIIEAPPYDAFQEITANLEALISHIPALCSLESEREAALSQVNKKENWIETVYELENTHYEKLKAYEPIIQAHYAPLEEKVLFILSEIDKTKKALSSRLKEVLTRIDDASAPFIKQNTSIQKVGLSRASIKASNLHIYDIHLKKTLLEEQVRQNLSLSHDVLFKQRDLLLLSLKTSEKDIIDNIHKDHDSLKETIKREKASFNDSIKSALDLLRRLTHISQRSDYHYDRFYIDPGHYEVGKKGKTEYWYIHENRPCVVFTIESSLKDALTALLFPDKPYTDETSDGIFIQKRKALSAYCDTLNLLDKKHQLIEKAKQHRRQSTEIAAIKQIREEVSRQLKDCFPGGINYCRDLLLRIDNDIALLEERYLHLQIKDKNQFLRDAINTVKSSVTHSNLIRLSDNEKDMFTQFLRLYILSPLHSMLEWTSLCEKGHLTFFAGPKEKTMMSKSKTVLKELEKMKEQASLTVTA